MGNITDGSVYQEDLRRQVSELASAVSSLPGLLDDESTRILRGDQVARLNLLRSTVLGRVGRIEDEERTARNADSQAKVVGSWFRLGAGLLTMGSSNRSIQAMSRQWLTGAGERELPFGTVLVRVSPKGIPDGVDVVNISRLARESYRSERQVMDRLIREGNFFFSAEAFSHMVDRLAAEILQGRLSLPMPTERLPQLQEKLVLQLSPRKD